MPSSVPNLIQNPAKKILGGPNKISTTFVMNIYNYAEILSRKYNSHINYDHNHDVARHMDEKQWGIDIRRVNRDRNVEKFLGLFNTLPNISEEDYVNLWKYYRAVLYYSEELDEKRAVIDDFRLILQNISSQRFPIPEDLYDPHNQTMSMLPFPPPPPPPPPLPSQRRSMVGGNTLKVSFYKDKSIHTRVVRETARGTQVVRYKQKNVKLTDLKLV